MALTDPLLVWPYWLERQIDPASPDFVAGSAEVPANLTQRTVTTLGTLDRPERATVDPRGLVTAGGAGWSLDWWIGAEDRWHLPSRSRAVRQRPVGRAPVVETAMRVPGGEVLHRAYGFLSGALGPCVGIEIENRSAVPVAVALAVRPYHPLGAGAVRTVEVEGAAVHVDGRPVLVLARPPAEARFGDHARGDVLGSLLAGDDVAPARTVNDAGGRATAAVVSPLAHTAILRAVIPLAPGPAPAFPEAVPSAEQVAKGWDAQTRRGLQVDLPDARWQEVVDTARTHLLLARTDGEPADAAAVVDALDQWGFADEAAAVLATWPDRQGLDGAFISPAQRHDAAGAALAALAGHWRLTGDAGPVDTLVGPVAKAVRWMGRRRRARRPARDARAVGLFPDGGARPGGGPPGTYLRDAAVSARALAGVADALEAAGQPGVAADARHLAAALRDDLDATIAVVAPGGAVLPPTPGRAAGDGGVGVVVNVDLFKPFGVLPLDHPSAGATLDAIRALPAAGTAAVPRLDGPAGLSPALTAQLAVLEMETADPRAAERLAWLVAAAGPTAVWPGAVHPRTGGGSWGEAHDPVATAAFLVAVRRLLVRERSGGAGGPGLALCSVLPPAWRGQSLDVRRAPTAFGRFSFSVRWHGARPALLWELEPHAGVTTVALSAPGLDPAWTGAGLAGEALLAAGEPDPADEGASFS
jgi:hypothetical protein